MIQTIASVGLPVDETLRIQKNRLEPKEGSNGKRISIVTGIHGDELEGQYICFETMRRLKEHPEHLKGTVDLYPAMNPLGIDSITRGVPAFDLDMNRLFPGSKDGDMLEYLAYRMVEDLTGSDVCVDIHASNIYLREIPQVRINERHEKELTPLAKKLNVDFIWVHSSSTMLEVTLAYSLNSRNTPTLVVETGVGMRITKAYCDQLTDGLFCLMKELGLWEGETAVPREPIVSRDGKVCFLNASTSGIFVPGAKHWMNLEKGDLVGRIVDPMRGEVLDEIFSPVRGVLFTLREYPVVDEGSLVARILEQ